MLLLPFSQSIKQSLLVRPNGTTCYGHQLKKQFINWEERVLKKLIRRLVKKHGMRNLLIMVGDWAVSASKSDKDDEAWETIVKPFIEENF